MEEQIKCPKCGSTQINSKVRKLLLLAFIIALFNSCAKDDPDVNPQNVTPYILVQADQQTTGYTETKQVVNDGSIEIHYGVTQMYKNKAFTYKLELAKVSTFHYLNGEPVFMPIDDDKINYTELDKGSVPEDSNKGTSIDYVYDVESTLEVGGYRAIITTECDGDSELEAYYFNVVDKL